MKVLIAMDSFKGTYSSLEVASLVETGIRRVYPDADVKKIAVADGGEGTAAAVTDALNGEYIDLTVHDPVGRCVCATYGVVNGGSVAVIEMAAASGLSLLKREEQNPMITSTAGTGELIADALSRGCRTIILGIGGSATNDGGAGMAKALGVRFLDSFGNEIPDGGAGLGELDSIDISGMDKRILETEFILACDVNNPLCGKQGASSIYGPQKGADDSAIAILDSSLARYANIVKLTFGADLSDAPGAGAAGGLGYGMMVFLNAMMQSGIDVILNAIRFEEIVTSVDVVVTGEGRIDAQTANGKTPVGIAKHCKSAGVPVFAIGGSIDNGAEFVYDRGVNSIFSAIVKPSTLQEAIECSDENIPMASERLFRVIRTMRPDL